MTITGAEAMVRVLRQNGLTTAFSLAGTAHTHLLAAMDRAGGFDVVSTRHETCTVLAADGYARTTGRVAVAMIKNEQGLPNAMTGICTANAACSPVVVLSSLAPSGSVEAGGERARISTWWPAMRNGAASCPPPTGSANTSIWRSSARRAGALVSPFSASRRTSIQPASRTSCLPFIRAPRRPRPIQLPSPNSPSRLASARRPLILVGAGARDAEAALRRFAQTYRIPVLGNSLGRGLVAEDNELGFSWPLAQVAAKDADLVIALGIRFTQRLGYGMPPRFGSEAFFAQVDICADEFARNRADRPADPGGLRTGARGPARRTRAARSGAVPGAAMGQRGAAAAIVAYRRTRAAMRLPTSIPMPSAAPCGSCCRRTQWSSVTAPTS